MSAALVLAAKLIACFILICVAIAIIGDVLVGLVERKTQPPEA